MNIGITDQNRKIVSEKLQNVLADEFVLYTKTRNYHWNVEAVNFMELHRFYEEMYNDLAEIIDDVAERIRSLGYYSAGRLIDFLELTQLPEQDYVAEAKGQLNNLIQDHESIIRLLREYITIFDEDYHDLGTSDFVTSLMQKHEKMVWILHSYKV